MWCRNDAWCRLGFTVSPIFDLFDVEHMADQFVQQWHTYSFCLTKSGIKMNQVPESLQCTCFFPICLGRWSITIVGGEAMPKTSAEGDVYGLMVKSVKTPAIPNFCCLFLQCSGCCRYCMLRRYVWCLDFGNPMLRRWRFRMAFPRLLQYPNLDWMGLTNGVNVEDMGTPNETNWWGM